MKEALCKEFCDQLQVRKVPAGIAVGTNFIGPTGDPIGFYVVGPDAHGRFRVEDSGVTVPILESCGADLDLDSRFQFFNELLSQYQAEYDEASGELKTQALSSADVPKAAVRFVAMLLRLQDILLLTKERAESTFRQEAIRDAQKALGDRATITFDDAVSESIGDIKPDMIIRADNRMPVAVFLVSQDAKLYEAMLLQNEAQDGNDLLCKVVALMEHEASVSKRAFGQALNRLIPLRYRGDEKLAMERIVRETLGYAGKVLH